MKLVSGNDDVYTPRDLSRRIVEHYSPSGSILEPCRGDGAFTDYLPGASWCEIKEGRNFFDYNQRVDWIITNPPWSLFTGFLRRSLKLASNVVFLITLNHVWTKSRIQLIFEKEFYIRELILVDTPNSWPATGFQLGVVYLAKEAGPLILTDWTTKKEWWDI